jgi:hypothetical protein
VQRDDLCQGGDVGQDVGVDLEAEFGGEGEEGACLRS